MRFFTSDNHWGHANIMKYCPMRKFATIAEHDKELERLWNETVKDEDEVWVIGDWCFMDNDQMKAKTKRLKGKKHLIIGNHDTKPWAEYIRAGFLSVQRFAMIHIDGVGPVGLAHDPSNCIIAPDIVWLNGHLHQQYIRFGNSINVGVDVRNMKPISEIELAEDFKITKIHMKKDIFGEKEILGKE